MAVDTVGTTALYNTMITDMKATLDVEFGEDRIKSDIYGTALVSIIQQTMQLATSTIQQQVITDAQVAKITAETSIVLQRVVGRQQ